MALLTAALGGIENSGSGLPALVHRFDSGCSWHQVTIPPSAVFGALAEDDAEGVAAGVPLLLVGVAFPLLQAAVNRIAAMGRMMRRTGPPR